jgi:hypothetical protein
MLNWSKLIKNALIVKKPYDGLRKRRVRTVGFGCVGSTIARLAWEESIFSGTTTES